MYINPYYCCFPQVHPFAFIVIVKDCPEIAPIFRNLNFEYLPNYWSELNKLHMQWIQLQEA